MKYVVAREDVDASKQAMALAERIKKCATFDHDEFIAVATDEKATGTAWTILAAASIVSAAGLTSFGDFIGLLEFVVIAILLSAVAVYVAIHTSATSAQTVKRPLAQWIRVAGFAAVPGLAGIFGIIFAPFAWVAVAWWMATLIHAVGIVRNPATKKIDWDSAIPMVLAGALILGAWVVVFGSIVSFLAFLLLVYVIINHRSYLAHWCDYPPGTQVTPWKDLRALWAKKRWDITLDELVTIIMGTSPTANPEPVTAKPPPLTPDPDEKIPEKQAEQKPGSKPEPSKDAPDKDAKAKTVKVKEKDRVEPVKVKAPEKLSDSVKEFRDRCFGADVYGLESEKRFNEEFKGKNVKWAGELVRAEPYAYDRFLGRENGFRAIFALAPIKSDFGEKQLEAVVQISKGRFEELEKQAGTDQDFAGELLALESYTCRVYLRSAAVLPKKEESKYKIT
tara:strand:+ start:2614 stop:3963 length:1350 start_codon:yes stop_codon:yes gene_type:complete